MSEAKQNGSHPVGWDMSGRQKCVNVKGREYTVSFRACGCLQTVQVHVKRDGYTVAMRRLPPYSAAARAAIAAATGSPS